MTTATLIALAIGTAAMWVLIFLLMIRYRTALWKSVPTAVLLTLVGLLSTYIWAFVEMGGFGARSFYGAVFLVPAAFILIAKLIRIPYRDLMDFCAPAECAMLIIMKYQCLVEGCCGGRVIYTSPLGVETLFPSQIVELVNAAVLVVVLMLLAFHRKNRGKIYAWYLILYGITRFVLNFFRAGNDSLLFGLKAGNIWSLISVFIGILWLTDHKIAILKRDMGKALGENDNNCYPSS